MTTSTVCLQHDIESTLMTACGDISVPNWTVNNYLVCYQRLSWVEEPDYCWICPYCLGRVYNKLTLKTGLCFALGLSGAHPGRQCGSELKCLQCGELPYSKAGSGGRLCLLFFHRRHLPYLAVPSLSFHSPAVFPLIPCPPVLLSSFTSKEACDNDISKYS